MNDYKLDLLEFCDNAVPIHFPSHIKIKTVLKFLGGNFRSLGGISPQEVPAVTGVVYFAAKVHLSWNRTWL